jgi:septum formation protein
MTGGRLGGRLVGAGALILASGSPARRDMLRRAGLTFEVSPAAVDEDAAKASLKAEGATAHELADTLAELKATRVSAQLPGAFVIGADQVLVLDGQWFDKPADRAEAKRNLQSLAGKTHQLVSAAVVVRDGQRLWGHADHATLLMRPLTDAFIDLYLDAAGDAVLGSVGCYQLEGLGAQLFQRVDGDYFTILGMPLLPLLDFLRGHDFIPA